MQDWRFALAFATRAEALCLAKIPKIDLSTSLDCQRQCLKSKSFTSWNVQTSLFWHFSRLGERRFLFSNSLAQADSTFPKAEDVDFKNVFSCLFHVFALFFCLMLQMGKKRCVPVGESSSPERIQNPTN